MANRQQPMTHEGAVPDYQTVAARVSELLADPHTPADLLDALEEFVNNLGNDTQITTYTPEVARVALPLMLEVAERVGGEDGRIIRSHETRAYLAKRRAGEKGGR